MNYTILAAVSKDGYIADEYGTTNWTSNEDKQLLKEYLKQYNVHVMGRKTYDAHIQSPTTNKTRIVLTNNNALLRSSTPHTIFTNESLQTVLGKHAEALILGGQQLYEAALASELITEVVLIVEPITLHKGTAFVTNWNTVQQNYMLASSEQLNSRGTLLQKYQKLTSA